MKTNINRGWIQNIIHLSILLAITFVVGYSQTLHLDFDATIKIVSPNVIENKGKLIPITIKGANFNQNSVVLLFHPRDKTCTLKLSPSKITFSSMRAEIPLHWFNMLKKSNLHQQLQQTKTKNSMQGGMFQANTPFFYLAIINKNGHRSNAMKISLKSYPARITRLIPQGLSGEHPIHLRAGTQQKLEVQVQRNKLDNNISVQLQAFKPADHTLPRKDHRANPIEGISGTGTIQAGKLVGELLIKVDKYVEVGRYEIILSLGDSGFIYEGDIIVQENPEVECKICGPLFAPSGFEIVAHNSSTIHLRWVDNSVNEDGFRIEQQVNGVWEPIHTVHTLPSSPTGLVNWEGTDPAFELPACYRVVVYNNYGELISGEDCGEPNEPWPPLHLRLSDIGKHSVKLSFVDRSTTEDNFYSYRAACYDCPYGAETRHLGHPDGTGVIERTHQNLASDTYYCFKVKAVNQYGSSSWADITCGRTEYVPPAPKEPSRFDLQNITQTSINLRWKDNSNNEDGFKIKRRTGEGSWGYIKIIDANEGTGSMEWTDNGLTPDTRYCYEVKAYNDSGEAFSGPKCADTWSGEPPLPDLIPSQMWIDNPTKPNKPFNVIYEVCNMGASIENGFRDVLAKDDNMQDLTYFSKESLPAFECYRNRKAYPNGVKEGCYIWEILTDADNSVIESGEPNNYGWINVCFW